MLPEINEILNALANSHMYGWDFHHEDDCHIFIKHKADKQPCCHIRKDNGLVEMLNGTQFYENGIAIGWRLSGTDFLKRLKASAEAASKINSPVIGCGIYT